MKKRKTLIVFLLGVLALSGCGRGRSSNQVSQRETSFTSGIGDTYTITFYSEGGTTVAPIIAEAGAAISKPADPIRQGFEFLDW